MIAENSYPILITCISPFYRQEIYILPNCPACGRFVTHGQLLENENGNLKFTGWNCVRHGAIEPEWERAP